MKGTERGPGNSCRADKGRSEACERGSQCKRAISMPVAAMFHQLQTLPPKEVAKVRDWLIEHVEESPELLATVEKGMAFA